MKTIAIMMMNTTHPNRPRPNRMPPALIGGVRPGLRNGRSGRCSDIIAPHRAHTRRAGTGGNPLPPASYGGASAVFQPDQGDGPGYSCRFWPAEPDEPPEK